MDKIIITAIGLAGIAFTYWFFLMKKGEEVEAEGSLDVIVEGGYSPEVIHTEKNKKLFINFIRKDSNSCLEEVVFPDFKIRKTLPLNQSVQVEINPTKSGEYSFTCGMNMFHGKVVVS